MESPSTPWEGGEVDADLDEVLTVAAEQVETGQEGVTNLDTSQSRRIYPSGLCVSLQLMFMC